MAKTSSQKDYVNNPKTTAKSIVKVISILVIILTLVIGGMVGIVFIATGGPTLEEPTLSINQTSSEIIVDIKCLDDYDYVIVKVNLMNKDRTIIKSFTVRADDCKEGDTVQKFYTPSTNDMLITRYTSAIVTECK